jgi:sugar lactone lactonase YvrE
LKKTLPSRHAQHADSAQNQANRMLRMAAQKALHSLRDFQDDVLRQRELVFRRRPERRVVRKFNPGGQVITIAGDGLFDTVGPDAITATKSALNNPRGVAIAPNGDIIIADSGNHQIHRVDGNGVIYLIAGSLQGKSGNSGDNGPAASALLDNPSAVAYDAAGNLYIADQGNNKIRMISASTGSITTVIGNGFGQSSGDGLSATLASIYSPSGLAVDSAGNVYIAESLGRRIRKVALYGIISTYAGTGNSGSGTPGTLATSSSFGILSNLTLDRQGYLCFADGTNDIVWRILPDGTLSALAGSGKSAFSGDGGPAAQAALNYPAGIVFGSDGTLYIADSGNDRIRTVLAASPTSSASASTMSFNVTSGGTVSAPQTFALFGLLGQNAFNGLPYSITTSTSSGTGWLQVTPSTGSIPATIAVSIDPTNLVAGAYTGGISINCPGANPSTATVAVSVVVTNSLAPQMSLSPSSLAFSTLAGASATSKVLTVSNIGGGSLNVTAVASGGSWLSVTPASGSVTANQPLALTVSVSPGALPPQTYSGSVLVSNGQAQIAVPVTMTVSSSQAVIVLSQVGMTLQSAEQSGAPLPQSFGILNTGQGQMIWSATARTLPAGAGWLSIDQSSGTVTTPFTDVSTVNVTVNPTGTDRSW